MPSDCPIVDCTSIPQLRPNPDVSGIGILTGFIATAYLSLFCCTANYILRNEYRSNDIDRRLDSFLPKRCRAWRSSKSARKWIDGLDATIMALSDQQVVTGLAILISGYTQLQCSLSSFHWQVTVSLAWFCSVTHLMTLTCLQGYLQKRPLLRLFRLIAMAIMAILLVCAFVPASWLQEHKGQSGFKPIPFGLPAQCLFDSRSLMNFLDENSARLNYNYLYMVISLIYLICSLFERGLSLYPGWSGMVRSTADEQFWKRIEHRMILWQHAAQTGSQNKQLWCSARHKMAIAWIAVLLSATDLYGSILWEVTWQFCALAWGMMRLIGVRSARSQTWSSEEAQAFRDLLADESTWGFGQVVAIILLGLPLVSYFEAVYESSLDHYPSEICMGLIHVDTDMTTESPVLGVSTSSCTEQQVSSLFDRIRQNKCYSKLVGLEYMLLLLAIAFVLYIFGSQEIVGAVLDIYVMAVAYIADAVPRAAQANFIAAQEIS